MTTQIKAPKSKKRAAAKGTMTVPAMPPADADGYFPAAETVRVIIAREIIARRRKAGWSQAELAKRAGIRAATVSRLEEGKHAPNVRAVEKIDRALTDVDT